MNGMDTLKEKIYDVYGGLKALMVIQNQVSGMVIGAIPPIGQTPTKAQVTTYFLAMMVEVGELVQELNWKPWKETFEPDPKKVADEFADILAFLGLILVYLRAHGITPFDLADAYETKTRTNIDRFSGKVAGYKIVQTTDPAPKDV
jgi:NTP pyrophosphatase (non-canonical NTP hydrolase)